MLIDSYSASGNRGLRKKSRTGLGKIIYDCQHSDSGAICAGIMDKIHGPRLVRHGCFRQWDTKKRNPFLSLLPSNRQSFLSVDSLCSFMVIHSSFFPQQRMEPWATVSLMFMSQFFHSFSQILIVFFVFLIAVCRSGKIYQPASLPFASPKGGYHVSDCGSLRFGR